MGLKIISNNKSFFGNFETHGILWKFLNPWYLTEVFKLMVFNRGYEILVLRFKIISREHALQGCLREKLQP